MLSKRSQTAREGDDMNRRAFLATGAASAGVAGLARHGTAVGAAPPDAPRWRAFEVTTRAEIVNPTGGARAWLPLPLMPDTDYHKSQGQSWTGNATTTRIYREPRYGAAIFYAEWPATEPSPLVEVTTRFATRDRAVDLKEPGEVRREDKRELAKYLAATIPPRAIYGIGGADSAEFKSLGKSGDISKAQHCRAECYLPTHGWVPVDPADVRKVVLEEKGGLSLGDATVQRARAKLFGAWEMNYLAYNYAHDVKLPNSAGDPIAFFMYPQAESGGERRDSLDPDTFRYRLTSHQLAM